MPASEYIRIFWLGVGQVVRLKGRLSICGMTGLEPSFWVDFYKVYLLTGQTSPMVYMLEVLGYAPGDGGTRLDKTALVSFLLLAALHCTAFKWKHVQSPTT